MGSELKRYKLDRVLCRGGMADISLLIDPDGQQVVLRRLRKVHRWRFSLRRRFKHGLQLRSDLGDHPAIVRQLTFGGRLLPYEIIEYVSGPTLKAMIVQGHALLRNKPFACLEQVALGIAHLHDQGYLHLDVKPENFLVQVHGESCTVKLTDFDFCQPALTRKVSRYFGGSVAYCPPEFLSAKEVSPQTDVFAFGVLAYQVFTQQMPFVESSHDLLRNNKQEVQIRQSDHVTPAVEAFLRRCLDVRTEYRYSDFNVLLRGLHKAAENHHQERCRQKSDDQPPWIGKRPPRSAAS